MFNPCGINNKISSVFSEGRNNRKMINICWLILSPEHYLYIPQIYLVAENAVLKINPSKIGSIQPPSKVLYSHNSSEEIMGLSISPGYLSLFITIKNRGLFSFFLRGELQWSIGPTLHRLGYTLGCKNDPLNCYFNSAPVVDLCEGTLYVS